LNSIPGSGFERCIRFGRDGVGILEFDPAKVWGQKEGTRPRHLKTQLRFIEKPAIKLALTHPLAARWTATSGRIP
jgi:hypothetical protein